MTEHWNTTPKNKQKTQTKQKKAAEHYKDPEL